MDKSEFQELFSNICQPDYINQCFDNFEIYYKELIEYNNHTNLTAITDKTHVYIKHFYDSCLADEYITHGASVVDIGTGAGFPGVPIKITRPDINLHLVDSLNKRINFLNMLRDKINLNYSTYHSRAEDFCTNLHNREKFDVCVSRAVSKLNTLAEYCLPLVKIGGVFIAYKGNDIEQEINEAKNAIKTLGGEILKIIKLNLPDNMGERNLIFIRKINKTPNKYPRNKNLPKIKPL